MDTTCSIDAITLPGFHQNMAKAALVNTQSWDLYDELDHIQRIEKMVKDVIATDDDAFDWRIDRWNNKQMIELRLAKYFYLARSASDFHTQLQYPERHLSLYAEVFFTALHNQDHSYSSPGLSCTVRQEEAERFNQLIHDIRQRCKTPWFRQEHETRGNLATGMYYRMVSYARRLINRHRKLLILRVDFYLPSAYQDITAEQAKAYLKHFLDNRRSNPGIFKHDVGYIWKLEHGQERGFHFHCIFFLNGSTANGNGIYWADQYGQYWEGLWGGESGLYHNCNREKLVKAASGRYRYNQVGVGHLQYTDHLMRRNLYCVIAYLAKQEQAVPMKARCGRTWACGELNTRNKPGPVREERN